MYPMGASLCLKCGYRWNSPHVKPPRCPNCKTEEWDKESEGEACGLDGGICDQCGCRFTTELGKAKYCPNCRSDKWDSGTSLEQLAGTELEHVKCKLCGHRWIPGSHRAKTEHFPIIPTKCPKCRSRKWNI